MGLGLLVRRLSLPLSALTAAALGGWAVLDLATGGGAGLPSLTPIDLGASAGFAGRVVEAISTAVVLLLGLRLLAFAIGGLGWLLLPPEHRDMLGRLTQPPPASPRDDELDLCRAGDGPGRRPARSGVT